MKKKSKRNYELAPSSVGSVYYVKVKRWLSDSTYLATTSSGVIVEVTIDLAKECTKQECIDLIYAYENGLYFYN